MTTVKELNIEMNDGNSFSVPLDLAKNSSNVIKEEIDTRNILVGDETNKYYYMEEKSQDIDVLEEVFKFHKKNNGPSFFEDFNNKKLFAFTLAVNYLDCPLALDAVTTYIADIIKRCRSPDEIRNKFGISED